MKTKIKNIKYWVEYNNERGILAHVQGEKRFISESEIETTDIDDDSLHGLFSDCDDGTDEDSVNGDYSKESPRRVVYSRHRNFRNKYSFKALCHLWVTEQVSRIEEAYLELCVTTGWKSDYESERTKMLRKIDECRKNNRPCGVLRSEWVVTVGRLVTDDYTEEGLEGDPSFCFYDLVEEVESWYKEDDE